MYLIKSATFARLAALTVAIVGLWITKPVTMQGKDGPQPRKIVKIKGHDAVDGDVLVKFRRKLRKDEHDQLSYQVDAESSHDLGSAGLRLIHSKSYDSDTLLHFLERHPDVAYVEPNYVVQGAAILPNDPSFDQMWGLRNPFTPGVDIGATAAWAISTGSKATVVAVVDSGIDYNHPDLAANVWSAPQAFTVNVGWMSITCAAGTHGFNAVNNTCDPMDDAAHGSHVSGTIGAVGNNGIGVTGVNWNTSIMALKFLDANGSGTMAGAYNALDFVIQAKALTGANVRVLSNSWGGPAFSQAILDLVNKANDNDMLFVAAAGNNGRNADQLAYYPANYSAPNVVSVTATDSADGLPSFANYGATTVDLGAPGVNILSTVPNGGYASGSGTSMATPHVAGAAALILSRCALTPVALKALLLSTVDHVASLATTTVSGGRLNVGRALQSCTGASSSDFSVAAGPATQSVSSGSSVGYTATVTSLAGFTGAVSFAVSGLPTGAAASFAPATVTGSGLTAVTVTTSAATTSGTYPLTITATSGTLTHTATVSLSVVQTQPSDFSLAAGPSSRTVNAGLDTSYLATVTSLRGFSGSVSLSASGLPTGATSSFAPQSLVGSGSSNLMVHTTASTAAGTYTVTITAVSGALVHTTTATLVVVNKPADFTLTSLVSANQAVNHGVDGTFLIAITPVAGFTGAVTLSTNALANGTTTTFSPVSVTLDGTRSVVTSLYVDITNWRSYHYQITVTATGGGLSRNINLDLQVK